MATKPEYTLGVLSRDRARTEFVRLCQDAGEDLRLDMALLLIAAEEVGTVDVGANLRRLDGLAERFAESFPAEARDVEQLAALSEFLFVKENYRGNQENYYDLRNSYLNDVLDRRMGIPITLSVLAMEVARRVGMSMVGIGFPGHFLVSTASDSGLYLDAFRGGQLLRREDCRTLLLDLSGGNVGMKSQDLAPVTHAQIVGRVLQNIKGNYLRQQNLEGAVSAVDRILVLFPDAHGLLRERGLIYLQLGAFSYAVEDLRAYLRLSNDPPDAEAISAALDRAEKKARLLL
jgi:regulator of sirC expression with transglutaminase-like and TPR domain